MSSTPEEQQNRSAFKWTIVGCGSLVFVLILASGLYVRLSGSAPVVEPFDVDAFVSISVPAEKNAARFYREAAPLFVRHETPLLTPAQSEAFDKSSDEALAKDWKFANKDVRDWLEANRPAMEIWKRGSELRECLDVPPDKVHLTIDSPLGIVGGGTFALPAVLEAARLTSQGRIDEAWDWYRSVLRSSRHIGMHAATIWRGVGAAMHAIAATAIISWAARPEVTAAQLRNALDETLAIDAMTPPMSDSFKVDYLAAINNLGEAEAELGRRATIMNVFGARQQARRSLRLIFTNWLSQVDRPRFRRTAIHRGNPDLPALYELDSGAPPGSPSPAEIESQYGLASELLQVVLSDTIGSEWVVFDATDREQARRSALILALALELYDREHGELPAELEALVDAGYLKSIPADPFGKGEPFRYRRAANPADGGLLWSVWTDGIDQDGKVSVDAQPNDSPGVSVGDKCFAIRVPAADKQRSCAPAKPSAKP